MYWDDDLTLPHDSVIHCKTFRALPFSKVHHACLCFPRQFDLLCPSFDRSSQVFEVLDSMCRHLQAPKTWRASDSNPSRDIFLLLWGCTNQPPWLHCFEILHRRTWNPLAPLHTSQPELQWLVQCCFRCGIWPFLSTRHTCGPSLDQLCCNCGQVRTLNALLGAKVQEFKMHQSNPIPRYLCMLLHKLLSFKVNFVLICSVSQSSCLWYGFWAWKTPVKLKLLLR